MMLPVLALLTVLTEGFVEVPRSRWTVVDVPVATAGTIVKCTFRAPDNTTPIQAWIATADAVARFQRGLHWQPIATSSFEADGSMVFIAESAGTYHLLLDNRMEGRRAAKVWLRIETVKLPAMVQTVPVERRRLVVIGSLLYLCAVVAWSARKFMK